MGLRIGDVLVMRGALTEEQRRAVLERQEESARPFGDLAERLFGVAPAEVEDAWAEQYAQRVGVVDPAALAPTARALALVSMEEALAERVLCVRIEGGHLVACTTRAHLVRAVEFALVRLSRPVELMLAPEDDLIAAIRRWYASE